MPTLNTGDQAPAISLLDQHSNTVTLEQFKGKKVLIYFYPKASTPGCTTQSCNVRDALEELSGHNVVALGISPDEPKKQEKFDTKHSLGFPLLCDTDHAVAEAYDVWRLKKMYGREYMGILRSAFLIDEAGKVIESWYKVSPKDTVPNVLKALG